MNATDFTIDANDVAVLSANDHEDLLRAIEFAYPICTRGQLFVWAQSYLHSLLAHELLLCAWRDVRRDGYTLLKVSTFPLSDGELAEIADLRSGLMARAVDAWSQCGEEPLAVYPGMINAMLHDQFRGFLERYKFGNLVVHGARSIDGATDTFFVFAGVPHAFGARHAYLLNLITPYLRAALERTIMFERREQTVKAPPEHPQQLLTAREIHVLQWVREGKNSREIGSALKISPLTVRNHVRSILKKLKAENRAQAVSRALNLKLLK